MSETLRFGVLGAAYIAGRALIPAMRASTRTACVAIASRDPQRASAMAAEHDIGRVHDTYDALLEDREVDAVYIALHNSVHLEWTLRALDAGKHVLCEKPLGLNAGEVRRMAAAAHGAQRALMEAFMYRFHPRIQEFRAALHDPAHIAAAFGFTLRDTANYRWDPALGGGALLDVGCYTLDVLHWMLGEPEQVRSVMHSDGIDLSVACALRFAGGATATAWASFESAEHQELVVVDRQGTRRLERPFTSWRDPFDPYELMVDAFAAHILSGTPSPRPVDESLATAVLLDRVRQAASSR